MLSSSFFPIITSKLWTKPWSKRIKENRMKSIQKQKCVEKAETLKLIFPLPSSFFYSLYAISNWENYILSLCIQLLYTAISMSPLLHLLLLFFFFKLCKTLLYIS
ncbi:unnamed protein product [Citrullus colocynthis]|uniref:Uncharacterized protein n=1 Tax=Citrullus colocynthis TaxID=252529 RepID=A0ABP0Y2T6_9ROSI